MPTLPACLAVAGASTPAVGVTVTTNWPIKVGAAAILVAAVPAALSVPRRGKR